MFLCYSKINTKSSLVILNFKTLVARSCVITNKNLFHTTFTLNDSNDNKKDKTNSTDKDKNAASKKLAKLKQLQSTTKLISLDNVKKRATSNLNSFKDRTFKKGNEDVPLKIAKLIDRENIEKTAELLMNPLEKVSRKTEKFQNIDTKQMIDLKTLLDQAKKEASTKPPIDASRLFESKKKDDDTQAKIESKDDAKKEDGPKKKEIAFDLKNLLEQMRNEEIKNADIDMDTYNKQEIINKIKGQYSDKLIQPRTREKTADLSSGKGLLIFQDIAKSDTKLTHESPIWEIHNKEELQTAEQMFCLNGFEEMIKLTDEGKIWKFPIDNEQDVDEAEAEVPFYEHIFLESYLEKFPQIEPIQQFMTLVLNGISQNSFLNIKEKQEIIEWYRSYFEEKKDIINDALEAERMEAEYLQATQTQK